MKPAHYLPCLLALAFFASGLFAQYRNGYGPEDVIEVRIYGLDRESVADLTQMGVDIDGVWGSTARAYVFPDSYEALEALGYEMEIVPHPLVRDPGLRVGYHTIAELTAELQAIAANNPDICELYSIGNSTQGRALWFMKISDNVGIEEDEPEFKYISSMHGDEVVGMELCMNLINLLVDEYGSDPQITNLVNEVEIWIMPLMNPDGYVAGSRYNAQGYDLNRNFPDRIVDPDNTPAGRPTEVQRVMNWQFDHYSVLSANFHGGALVVNYPYDSDPNPNANYSATPDDDLFIVQSLVYSSLNGPMYAGQGGFYHGITNGIAWYLVYGGMQDWNYVWMGDNEVTIELGQDKWPPYSQIAGLWDDNRESMLAYMAECLKGVRGVATDLVTGVPVAATVRVTGRDHNVYADPDVGDYHRMLLPGTYDLEFSADGYEPLAVTGVAVGSGSASRLDVALVPFGINPRTDIKINGLDDPPNTSSSEPVEVTIHLDPGLEDGQPADWWVFVVKNNIKTWWRRYSGGWTKTETPVRFAGATLRTVNSYTVLNRTIPWGSYVFTFAVDDNDNHYEGTYIDTVAIFIY